MLRDDNLNGLGQQIASSAPPPVVTGDAAKSMPATGDSSGLRIAIGVVALAVSFFKLLLWLTAPTYPTVTYRPISVPSQAAEASRSLAKCEILFPTGHGAVPGINCSKSDLFNKTK